jgi:hypothetical protein
MRKYGKFLLLVAVAALAAMAIGAASASAATVNNPGSHSVVTTDLHLTSPFITLDCRVSMTFYVSANTDTIVTSVTVTNCTNSAVVTPSNVPTSTNGNPPASPWNPGGVWRDWSGNVSGGGPNDWTGVLHNVQFSVLAFGSSCSYHGNMNVTYHNNGAGDPDGTFTAQDSAGLAPSSNPFLCGTGHLTTNAPGAPFTFSAGDAGFTIS